MKIRATSLATASILAATLAFGAAGCKTESDGEKTKMQARQLDEAGDMIMRGEQMQTDGKATVARGQSKKDQGMQEEGDRLIDEGQLQQKQGEAMIDQGKTKKMKASN